MIGREWHRAGCPPLVRAHDFPEKDAVKAVPYGIYDLAADAGWVSVGCDADTAGFAVATLTRWWHDEAPADHGGRRGLQRLSGARLEEAPGRVRAFNGP